MFGGCCPACHHFAPPGSPQNSLCKSTEWWVSIKREHSFCSACVLYIKIWLGLFPLFPFLCKSLPGDEEALLPSSLPLPVRSAGAAGTFSTIGLKTYWDRLIKFHFCCWVWNDGILNKYIFVEVTGKMVGKCVDMTLGRAITWTSSMGKGQRSLWKAESYVRRRKILSNFAGVFLSKKMQTKILLKLKQWLIWIYAYQRFLLLNLELTSDVVFSPTESDKISWGASLTFVFFPVAADGCLENIQ